MERRRYTSWGPQNPRNDMVESSLNFFFLSHISRLGAKEAGNLEMPMGTLFFQAPINTCSPATGKE